MPATRSLNFTQLGHFMKNVPHFVTTYCCCLKHCMFLWYMRWGLIMEEESRRQSFILFLYEKFKRLETHPEKFCKHIIFQCFDQFVCQPCWEVEGASRSNLACEARNRNVLGSLVTCYFFILELPCVLLAGHIMKRSWYQSSMWALNIWHKYYFYTHGSEPNIN